MNIKDYFASLEDKYPGQILYSNSKYDSDLINRIPKQMIDFYNVYGEMTFPFGRIYSIEKANEMSEREPFKSEDWFCFGQDNYFTFWLCKKNVEISENAFTVWDHGAFATIEEPFLQTLEQELDFLETEYKNNELYSE